MLEIRLLGEMQLLRDGSPVPLPASRKTRALLGYLVATARAQTRAHLCDLLWDGPDDPRAALRWSLTKLRPLLGDAVRSDREHASFERTNIKVDIFDVRAALGEGLESVATETMATLAQAFRGEFLENLDLPSCFRFQQWCVGERESLRQLRVKLLETLVRRTEADPESALRFARNLVTADPFSESAHIAVIRILGTLDRQRDALRQYDHCRDLFERELGRSPSPALDEARRAISARPSAAAAAPPAFASEARIQAAAPDVPLLGRDRELATINAAVHRTFFARPTTLLIFGEPGIGKSRLLAELSTLFRAREGTVLSARGYAAETARPYGVWVDALRPISASIPERLRPSLAPLLSSAAQQENETLDQPRLFEAVADLLARVGGTGVAVIIDDLQWADEASIALLHYVQRTLQARPVLFACGARSGELDENAAANRLAREWIRARSAQLIRLAPLPAQHVREIVAARGQEEAAERIAEECGGNPLFALEIARALAQGEDSLSGTLDEIIEERLTRLDPKARELVSWAAALGRNFDAEILGRATAMASGEMLSALDLLERHEILRGSTDAGTYDFSHDLIRQAAYRRLSGPRRMLVHRGIARAMEQAHDPSDALAGEIVRHATLAGEIEMAARASVAAAKRCLRVFAFNEAIAASRTGIALAEQLAPATGLPLRIKLVAAQIFARSPQRNTEEIHRAMSALADEAKSRGMQRAIAHADHFLAVLHEEKEDLRSAQQYTMAASELARREDPATASAAIATTGRCLAQIQRDLPRARALLTEAEALAREARSESTELPLGLGYLRAHDGDYEGAIPYFRRAYEKAKMEGDHWREWLAIVRLVTIELDRGQAEAALRLCDELLPIAERMSSGSELPRTRALRAAGEYVLGGPAAPLDASLQALRDIDSRGDLAAAQLYAAEKDLADGRTDAALGRIHEAIESAERVGRRSEETIARCLAAGILHERGEAAAAAAILRPSSKQEHREDLTARAREFLATAEGLLARKRRKSHGQHRPGAVVL